MALGYITNKNISIGIVVYSLWLSTSIAGPHIEFKSPMGEEKWRMTGNPIRCGLSLVVPNYGIGYFEQFAKKQPHFILRKWQQAQRSIPAEVYAKSPVWKPAGPAYMVTHTMVKPGEYGLYLSREPTLKLLTYLSQGYEAQFNYFSEEGFGTTVSLSPVKFQKVFARYQKCLGGLLPFDYDDVRESIFHFGVDSEQLSDSDKEQMRKIAQYIAADDRIELVRVVGYADDSGRKGYNNAVSEYRAESVKKYLLSLGVPKRKLSVTWYGALKPVARNDTDEGRAANRRVVVNLIKK